MFPFFFKIQEDNMYFLSLDSYSLMAHYVAQEYSVYIKFFCPNSTLVSAQMPRKSFVTYIYYYICQKNQLSQKDKVYLDYFLNLLSLKLLFEKLSKKCQNQSM